MTKRLLSSFLALLIVIGVLPVINAHAAVENTLYNSKKALSYADRHWDDGKGLCAEFVSDCLAAGGLSHVYNRRVVNLYNAILDNKCGKSYKLKITNGSILKSENEGKIKKGDPIFFYCNSCRDFTHVALCNGFNSQGYAVDYSHNNAHDGNVRTYTYNHCGTKNWTLYSISMYNEETLFGNKVSIDAPEIESLMNVKGGVYLKWNKVSDATYYRVYRRTENSNWLFLNNTRDLFYTDTTADNNVEYTYTVRACKASTFSQYFAGETVTYLSIPTFKAITNVGNTIEVSWNGNPVADGYYLYRQVNNEKWEFYTTVRNGKASSYTDKNVVSGNTYNYRIRAYKGDVVSSFDAVGIGVQCLTAPKMTSIVNVNEGIRVNWNTVAGADSYRVYRRGAGEKYWTYLGTTITNYYIDENVESASYYRYTIRSANANTFGSFDPSGLVIRCVGTPEIIGAQYSTEDGVNLSWESVKGAMGYYVYHKTPDAKHWLRIAVIDDNETSYEDFVPADDSTYIYTVKAFYGYTMSSYYQDGLVCVCDEELGLQTIPQEEEDVEEETGIVSNILTTAGDFLSHITNLSVTFLFGN